MNITNYEEFRELMSRLISSGFDRLDECLTRIEAELRVDEAGLKHTVTSLQSELADIRNKEIKEGNVKEKRKNKLRSRVLIYLDDFIKHRLSEMFYEKILVVSYSEDTMEKMNKFLNPAFFKGEIISETTQVFRADLAEGCDFVLFDNYHCPEVNSKYRRDLLDAYLASDNTQALLSFGPWIENYDPSKYYPHKFFAANSPFSLYARIRELREFLKIHGKPEHPLNTELIYFRT